MSILIVAMKCNLIIRKANIEEQFSVSLLSETQKTGAVLGFFSSLLTFQELLLSLKLKEGFWFIFEDVVVS